MSFHSLFCEHYDELFPASAEYMRWVNQQFAGKQHLLDIGCGTGNKTACLAGGRSQVVGIDADPTMIALAQQRHAAPNTNYLVMKVQDIAENIPPGNFGAVVCLGNTLPYFTGEGEVARALRLIRRTMTPSGLFIGHLLNYDRIVGMDITTLPVIETDAVVFRRTYDWREGVMYFRTELEEKASGAVHNNAIPLLPITKVWFEGMLREAGFPSTEFYGSLDGEPYSEQSYLHVFLARMER